MWIFLHWRSVALVAFLGVWMLEAGAALGEAPKVTFDVAQTARCYPASSVECLRRPANNVVEVIFDITTRLTAGQENDLKSITYEVRSPDRQLTVAGFLPATTMTSETVDGVINFEEHRSPAQLNLEYAGFQQAKIQAPLRAPTDTKVVMKKLAPQSLLMSSGTIDRAHGVYFTLHPGKQESVQRAHQFVCYFEVPETFRADYVQITCTAVAHDRSLGHSEEAELLAGSARFTVGIYRDGDAEARQVVHEFADRQQELVYAIAAYRRAAADRPTPRRSPTDVFKSVLFNVASKASPPATADAAGAKSNRQPSRVALAMQAVEDARKSIRAMNRTDEAVAGVSLSQKN